MDKHRAAREETEVDKRRPGGWTPWEQIFGEESCGNNEERGGGQV